MKIETMSLAFELSCLSYLSLSLQKIQFYSENLPKKFEIGMHHGFFHNEKTPQQFFSSKTTIYCLIKI